MSAAQRRAAREAREAGNAPVESGPIYRGIVVHPHKGGWLRREVAIPAHIVELYAIEERAPVADVKSNVALAMERFIANPDLLRRQWK